MMRKDVKLQRKYYTDTAEKYDEMHGGEDSAHDTALKYISTFMDHLKVTTVLDVGCGTGRGVQYFLDKYPDLKVIGVEPVQALINQGIKKGISSELLICAEGECLPFDDGSFDVVCSFGVLHHVAQPEKVVREMVRVARRAIFISDGNRFGQGQLWTRWIRLLLYKFGLWGFANYIKTKGRGYMSSEGDGIAYSYSVFDQYDILANWSDIFIFIPTLITDKKSWLHPLLTSSHVLLCCIKEANK
ncbi:class I SAM-dependent methyltransferase [Nostoc sp. FACHB-888]|uniref:class I SAM-dependent methyltransferase n=1 Tax=Nostoc sp. FACHB-888 TaxID=2692842 RepID=UPI00168A2766|nr:class I SAM-dependent methyltransferase [Nostoc sp. FACHB-888]MBD2245412.1 class I SAM-dependent methyltransferase [Nostoc sp. FACHB-888]